MRDLLRVTLVLLMAALSLPGSADAQSRRLFIGSGVIANNDHTNSALRDGTVASWTIVGGFDVAKHVGIRGLFEAPDETSTFAEGTYSRQPSVFPIHEQLTRTKRTMTYGVLGDVHGQVTPRVRLAGTFGVLAVTHDDETLVVRNELRPDGTRAALPDLLYHGDYDWPGIAFGMEAGVSLTPSVDVVPEVRVIYFLPSDSPHPYIVRSGIGVRWRF
jgi:hypothetical protein